MRSNLGRARWVLAVSTALSLVGWAMFHIRWEVPYRTFLWSEPLLRGFVEGTLGVRWETWVTGSTVEFATQSGMHLIGLGLLAAAWGAWRARSDNETRGPSTWLLPLATLSMLVCALLAWKEKSFNPAGLLEWGARVLAPITLLALARGWIAVPRVLTILKFATALTFLGHGLYAIGYYPVPGNFIDMTISILGVGEAGARSFLMIVGVIDIALAAAMVWSPAALVLPFLGYEALWGFLTALARPTGYVSMALEAPGGFSANGMAFWSTEMISRSVHWGLPLAAFFVVRALRAERLSEAAREGLSAQDMQVEMKHGLPAARA